MRGLGPFLRDAWHLSRPYFMKSEEKWSARGLLLLIIALRLGNVGLVVIFNFWRREFYNSLQDKDFSAFIQLLLFYRHTPETFMPGFTPLAALYIAIAVYATYVSQYLQIRWRRWLTTHYLAEWMADRAYYHIALTANPGAIGTDNPDQRIAEDLRDFTTSTLTLGVSFLSNVVSLFSFLGILWSLSGALEIWGVSIPGYMVWVCLAYAIIGTWLTHLVGNPLALLSFRQQRVEADFRYALVRVRENMEGIALYGGEAEEGVTLRERFSAVIANWRQIMTRTKRLNSLVNGYGQIAIIFPYAVAAPRYFSGAMQLGGLMQTASAFGEVQGAMSWFVDAYADLAVWRAVVERLATFHRAIEAARAAGSGAFANGTAPDHAVHLNDVTVCLPNGEKLLEGADITLTPGHSAVITGRSGAGKSTLFRVLAGIWPFGSGEVLLPPRSFFLPQRPYIPLGTLRHIICYPHASDAFAPEDIAQALRDAGMPGLLGCLDDDEKWPTRLSGGEQQRVALARALLTKPDWIFLDEATASLDPEAEAELYGMLKTRLPNATLVSIAHRPTVAAFHERKVTLRRAEGVTGSLITSDIVPEAAGG